MIQHTVSALPLEITINKHVANCRIISISAALQLKRIVLLINRISIETKQMRSSSDLARAAARHVRRPITIFPAGREGEMPAPFTICRRTGLARAACGMVSRRTTGKWELRGRERETASVRGIQSTYAGAILGIPRECYSTATAGPDSRTARLGWRASGTMANHSWCHPV